MGMCLRLICRISDYSEKPKVSVPCLYATKACAFLVTTHLKVWFRRREKNLFFSFLSGSAIGTVYWLNMVKKNVQECLYTHPWCCKLLDIVRHVQVGLDSLVWYISIEVIPDRSCLSCSRKQTILLEDVVGASLVTSRYTSQRPAQQRRAQDFFLGEGCVLAAENCGKHLSKTVSADGFYHFAYNFTNLIPHPLNPLKITLI